MGEVMQKNLIFEWPVTLRPKDTIYIFLYDTNSLFNCKKNPYLGWTTGNQVATIKYFHLTNEKNRILEKSGKYENDLEKDDIVQPAVIEANSAYKRDRGIHICFIPPYWKVSIANLMIWIFTFMWSAWLVIKAPDSGTLNPILSEVSNVAVCHLALKFSSWHQRGAWSWSLPCPTLAHC